MTDWINWLDGDRPPPPDALVEVRSRNYVNRVGLAGVFEWRTGEIIHYRILNQHLIDAARKEGLQKGLEAFDEARLAVEGDIQKLCDAARLEGIRLGLEAAAEVADHDWPDPNSPIRNLDPETIAREAKPTA